MTTEIKEHAKTTQCQIKLNENLKKKICHSKFKF